VNRRTPALIFDFGNVLAHFDYRKACDILGKRLGLTGEAFLERVRPLGFSPLVQEYERGRIDAKTFSKEVSALAGLDIPHAEFAAAWSDIFWLNEPVARLIPFLKERGYPLILGSNTNDLHATQFRRQFAETLAHFDHLILSYEVGHIKPAAEFFVACVDAAGATPATSVFIDDLPENVAGATAAGLKGIVYRDVPSLLEALEAHGVDVPRSGT
jgi:putative hydrolase of the HAD superfamily